MHRRLLLTCAVLSFLSGCARYPMGLSKEQWTALPPQQQAEYKAKQYQIDEDRRKVYEERRLQLQHEAAEKERLERERLEKAYANARYGDIITVVLKGGTVAFGGKHHPYEPLSFDLVRGESRHLELVRADKLYVRTWAVVRLSNDGNTFVLEDQSGRRSTTVNDGWDRGRFYQISTPQGNVAGVTVKISLKLLPGAPQRLIIEHR